MTKLEYFTYTLPNGIRCLHKRIKSPVAYCSLTINAGSRDEAKGEEGLAHFTEHCLFKGTHKRKVYHINNRLEKLGGELNAFTNKEETVLHATTLVGDLGKSAELIADIAFASVFPEREVEKEREVVQEEIGIYKDSPPERIYDEFEDLLFKGSSLGHNILGKAATVGGFTRNSITGFVERCYNTNQMVVAVSADIGEGDFIKLMTAYFGSFPANPRAFSRAEPSQYVPFNRSVNRSTHQAHCMVGNRAYGIHHPGRIPLALLTNILGGPAANSILNLELREKQGLTYNVESAYTPYSDTGVAAIYFSTEKTKSGRALEATYKILETVKTVPLSDRRLTQAKKQFLGQFSIAMENQESNMLGAAKSYMIYGDVDSMETISRKIWSVTPEDIVRTANEVFTDMSVLVYNGQKGK